MVFKALVVDDSRIMRNMVMNSLKKANLAEFQFTEAEDGSDAINKLSGDTDIVFMDWNMPKMNGFEACQEMHDRPQTRNIPVIMVTSEKSMGKVQDAMNKAGATAYICKPFTPDELKYKLGKLFQALEARKARVASSGGQPATQKKPSGFFTKLG